MSGPVGSRGAGAAVSPVTAEVVSVRPDGCAQHLTLSVPSVPQPPRPGQFLQVPPVPGDARVLPRTWWLAGGREDPAHGTSLEAVVPDEDWQPGERVALQGPLGRGFPLPASQVSCLVAGHGPGQGPARWLTAVLAARGCPTVLVLCADDAEGHLDLVPARRIAGQVLLTTPDQMGATLRAAAQSSALDLLYAAGPPPVVGAAAQVAREIGAASQVTVFDAGGPGPWCGVGLCHACEVVVSSGSRRRSVRACAVGPVLPGEALGAVTGVVP